jgi:hypothetical protein
MCLRQTKLKEKTLSYEDVMKVGSLCGFFPGEIGILSLRNTNSFEIFFSLVSLGMGRKNGTLADGSR